MRRCLFKLVVFLLLGAVVNVAVAWGCTVFSNPHGRIHMSRGLDRESAHAVSEHRSFGSSSLWEWNIGGLVTSQYDAKPIRNLLPRWANDDNSGPFIVRVYEGRGWPLLALSCFHEMSPAAIAQFTSKAKGTFVTSKEAILTGLTPARSVRGFLVPRALPLQPIWLGFAINTIFYAAILWLLTLGPFTVRRLVRRKRGRCIKCGYDLRGVEHEVCPECGVEVQEYPTPSPARSVG